MGYNKRRQNLFWEMVNLKVTIRYKVVSLQSTVKVGGSLKTVSRWNNNNSNNNVINRKSNFNTITTNLFFSVQLKLFFIDIQTWSTQCQFSSSLFCWLSCPARLSCLFIFSFLHLLLDILSLILTAQYLTHVSSMFVFCFFLFQVLIFYCSVPYRNIILR